MDKPERSVREILREPPIDFSNSGAQLDDLHTSLVNIEGYLENIKEYLQWIVWAVILIAVVAIKHALLGG